MKRILQIVTVAFIVAALAAAGLLVPRFRNMKSEYETAQAIRDLQEFVQQHGGRWPTSPEDLGRKYPVGGGVHLDYSVTSALLLGDPALLRDSIRPRSGKFYTFPSYDEMIDDLRATIRDANQGGSAPRKSGD